MAPAAKPAALAAPPRVGLDGATAFGLALIATLAVYFVPFGEVLGRPLVWFATMVHELGHGVTAILVGGRFVEFKMYPNGSGVAPVLTSGAGAFALVSIGGLVGPSLAGALGFVVARRERHARVGLAVIALFLTWALVFKVRTLFGAVFVAGVVAACGAVAWWASARVAQLVLMFLSVQLALSLWSDVDYMFSATAATGAGTMPSDSANIARMVGGTYWLWGAACAALSLAALGLGAFIVLRDRRAARP